MSNKGICLSVCLSVCLLIMSAQWVIVQLSQTEDFKTGSHGPAFK